MAGIRDSSCVRKLDGRARDRTVRAAPLGGLLITATIPSGRPEEIQAVIVTF